MTEQPLVTFALLAYNQEQFVREAIEGAFAQTYEPLEILLSDDCSSDRTFEIMEEMAAGYRGPHSVRAVRNRANLGVARHLLARGREAQGTIVVVAAGDDVSLPERTAILAAAHAVDDRIKATTSTFNLINSLGRKLEGPQLIHGAIQGHVSYIDPAFNYVRIQGSTAAYTRDILEIDLPEEQLTFPEDLLWNFVIYATGGRVHHVDEPLVNYRAHAGALTNRQCQDSLLYEQSETSEAKYAHQTANKLELFEIIAVRTKFHSALLERIRIDHERSEIIHKWSDMQLLARVKSLTRSIFFDRCSVKWKLVRLSGKLPDYQPKKFFSNFQKRYR